MTEKYFFIAYGIEKEITKEEFVSAERSHGFRPKGEDRGQCATGGFGVNGLSWNVRYV